jgi:hypothetical protein
MARRADFHGCVKQRGLAAIGIFRQPIGADRLKPGNVNGLWNDVAVRERHHSRCGQQRQKQHGAQG